MKPRLLLSLLGCALALAACYRQTEEPFRQVDSAEVVSTPTAALAVVTGEAGADAETVYITPEAMPGQVELPTGVVLTGVANQATLSAATITPFVPPTATPSFEEQLDPNDECVYQVQAGNVLFRLALAWETTYQDIMDLNQMASEDLSIGQLLLIPGCRASAPEVDVADQSLDAPPDSPTETPPPRPEFHVVSAGETLESISLRYRVDVNALIEINGLTNPNQLNVGQELRLPLE